MTDAQWIPTACNLCYANCGVLVQLDETGKRIERVKGDKAHPVSKGYTCNKALALDYYQNGRDRIMSPLKKNADGGFDPISWDQAFSEIGAKLKTIGAEHGPDKVMYYGGGGQGNHLGGSYAGSTMRALGIRYRSNALAQEKTGLGWITERMFGGMWHGDFDECDIALIIGKNPWQSNGMQRARIHMRNISKNPDRKLVVFDPRRSETADLADVHFAVEPGRDTWLLGAILGYMVQNNLHDQEWLEAHTDGFEAVLEELRAIPVADFAAFAGIGMDQVTEVAEAMGKTDKIAVYEDLGTEMAPNSTLCSYMNMLMFLIPGAYAKEGGTHLTAPLQPIYSYGASNGEVDEDGIEHGYKTSPVTGARILTGLIPCNSIPDEILTDHPNRFRGMICETANPAHSLADSQRMKEAFEALDLLVVMDIAMTETAELADYILPAATQYEKYEATFFNFEYPDNFFHLRHPIIEAPEGMLTEPEIHARLVEEIGFFEEGELDDLKAAAEKDLNTYAMTLFMAMKANPKIKQAITYVLYRTLGPVLPNGAASAASVFGLCQIYAQKFPKLVEAAGFEGQGPMLGTAMFEAILNSPSGLIVSRGGAASEEEYQFRKGDGKVQINMGEMVAEMARLTEYEVPKRTDAYPLLLCAGERRTHTANTAIRNPAWMKSNNPTALSIHPEDANAIGLGDASRARLVTKRGEAEVLIAHDDRMKKGTLSLPNGLGLKYPDASGKRVAFGVSPNDLTDIEDRDPFAGTPWHKHVRARLEPLAS